MGSTSPLVSALCLAVSACGAASPTRPTAASSLSLVVSLRNAGEAEFTLRNVGPSRVWVNTRLHMNGYAPPDPFQEISVTVTGPDGKPLPWSCRLRVRLADARDYRTLEPGEPASVTDPMFGRCFVLRQ